MGKSNGNYKDIVILKDIAIDDKTRIESKISYHPERQYEIKLWMMYPKVNEEGKTEWLHSAKGVTLPLILLPVLQERLVELKTASDKLAEEAKKSKKVVTITPELSEEFAAFLEFKAAMEAKKKKGKQA